MNKNNVGNISNVTNSTIVIGDDNQTNITITIDSLFLEGKEIIKNFKEEQKDKKNKLIKKCGNTLILFVFLFFVSWFFCSVLSMFVDMAKLTMILSIMGVISTIYSYLSNLDKDNQTQEDYRNRLRDIIRILNYHRQGDLASKLMSEFERKK
ncbi:hypothetical protein HPC38_05100 [Pasteurellaceae bacterium HPA106]|uniref:hypothetical protein n=1 Tax=Spirabiliibacterium pneumoniae TaxID=221400 RepID=UPI001AAD8283|nr:hypothetical protein [Spirabiliibacterium pneumoniae]MBE2896251.1 hypothetical protein [Spirabiliibacterium pneumoniae]